MRKGGNRRRPAHADIAATLPRRALLWTISPMPDRQLESWEPIYGRCPKRSEMERRTAGVRVSSLLLNAPRPPILRSSCAGGAC